MDFTKAKPVFEGTRITLRIMEERDATPRYAGWLNDPEVNRYLATKSATIEELQKYIEAKDTQSDALFFGVFLKPESLHIGTVKLEPLELAHRRVTISVMIGDKDRWGKGYAAEAMLLLINWCFDELGCDEMILGVSEKNTAAIRAYEKMRFTETSRVSGYTNYGGEPHDNILMTLKRGH